MRRWEPGEVIVRREVWRGHPWAAMPVYVVLDEPELLVLWRIDVEALLTAVDEPTQYVA